MLPAAAAPDSGGGPALAHRVPSDCHAGRPVLFGPHTRDVEHAVELLEKCGAGRRVADASELARALVDLLGNPAAADAAGRAGREEIARRRGSSARSLALVERLLAECGRRGCD